MEKHSKDSTSDDTVNENAENPALELTDVDILSIMEKRQQIIKKLNKLKKELKYTERKARNLEKFISQYQTSEFPPSYIEWSDSPNASPIRQFQNISEDSFEYLPNLHPKAHLKQRDVIYDPRNEYLQASIKEYNNSPPTTSDAKAQAAGTGAKIKARQVFTDSEETFVGKGKAAGNPKFRYVKKSKPGISSIKESSQETAVQPSKEASVAPETKTLTSQLTEAGDTRISPAVKRKELDSDECSGSSSTVSKLSENRADDCDLKLAKKLKSADEERPSKQCPTIITLLSQKNRERSDSPECTDQSQTDWSSNEREPLVQPSTSGLSKVIRCASSSEESPNFSGNDDLPRSEIEESLTSGSERMPQNDLESTLTSVSTDMPMSEIEESSLTSGSEGMPPSDIKSTLTSVSTDMPLSEIEESSLTSGSEGMPQSDIGSTLKSVSTDVPMSEIEESSLTSGSEGMLQ